MAAAAGGKLCSANTSGAAYSGGNGVSYSGFVGGETAAVLGGTGVVHGEVYAVSPELERVLDEIEEVWPQQTGEYTKREVVVQLDSTPRRELLCVLYEISPEHTRDKPVIAGGDWVLQQIGRASCRERV